MKRLIVFILFIVNILCDYSLGGTNKPNVNPSCDLLSDRWHANWINCPGVSQYDYGVFLFRKSFFLKDKPSSFVINISADNRYRLFVNGEPVCLGPARGDIAHWYYETVDIASFLVAGKNTLAAMVWNLGAYTPGAQMTLKTGLIVQGNSPAEEIVNTDTTWKVIQNIAYSPSIDYLHDVGCCDVVDALRYPWGWEKTGFLEKDWLSAVNIGKGQPYGTGTSYDWVLYPRDIPLMDESLLRMKTVRRTDGVKVSSTFLQGVSPLTIPANKKVSLLIDQTYLTTAYPELKVSGGKNSFIKLTYCEALFKDGQKANRDDVDGRSIIGFVDKFYPDGGINRLFRPLWFRTYRYIQVDIETKEEPLTIVDLYGMFTAYPFRENASFSCNDYSLKKVWDVAWRTARLCAHETYIDCPYYEQLQYIGDTRIQALISLYVDGDDRLMRKAIKMFDWSRSFEGITTSRYPCRIPQYIPPFSLYWINMVHDYWMNRNDSSFIKKCIPGIKTVLEWFSDKINSQTRMLGPIPHWNFVDWPQEWPWNNNHPTGGVPPGAMNGESSVLSLQLAYTLKDAIELLSEFGEKELADKYSKLQKSLCKGVWDHCWDKQRQIFADDLKQTSYSQHANIMGILSNAVPAEMQKDLFNRLMEDTTLIQATFYYRFYLFRALKKVGLAEKYVNMLEPWYRMMDKGLTTFAENPEPTRSDCHAWSASPLFDFLTTVCGVEPAEPGFRSIKIEPHFGKLEYIECTVPHPNGNVTLYLRRKEKKGIEGKVFLPENLSGKFVWYNKIIILMSGENKVNLF